MRRLHSHHGAATEDFREKAGDVVLESETFLKNGVGEGRGLQTFHALKIALIEPIVEIASGADAREIEPQTNEEELRGKEHLEVEMEHTREKIGHLGEEMKRPDEEMKLLGEEMEHLEETEHLEKEVESLEEEMEHPEEMMEIQGDMVKLVEETEHLVEETYHPEEEIELLGEVMKLPGEIGHQGGEIEHQEKETEHPMIGVRCQDDRGRTKRAVGRRMVVVKKIEAKKTVSKKLETKIKLLCQPRFQIRFQGKHHFQVM